MSNSGSKRNLLIVNMLLLISLIILSIKGIVTRELLNAENNSVVSYYLSVGIAFIDIIYFSILIYNKESDLNKHRTGILILTILAFLNSIIAGILCVIVYKDLEKLEKRELPKIEYKEYTNKYICLLAFIICVIFMFITFKNNLLNILIALLTLIIMIYLFRKQLVEDFKLFKQYFKEYTALVLKTWGKALLTLIIINLFLRIFTNLGQATNQEQLDLAFKKAPLIIIFMTVIYAPLVEELLFRGVLRKFIDNKYLFILISGVFFGALHVVDDFQSIIELLYILVYSSLGMYLASLYYKTNNICTNIYLHLLQNSLSVLGMFLTTLLK